MIKYFLDHLVEFEIKVRFLFIFLGPKSHQVSYLEIGRCMGTLMTNKEFVDCAYAAKNKSEIIRGIGAYTNKSLCFVVPSGEYDEDLLAPLIEWMKFKMKQKNNQKTLNGKDTKKIEENAEWTNESLPLSIKEKEFDPFERTRKPFGCLINEIKHRYSKYFSDIADGLNLHCMIAFCFIFTVCFAPALCFGGILGESYYYKF